MPDCKVIVEGNRYESRILQVERRYHIFGYDDLRITTDRGIVEGKYYRANRAASGVVFLVGAGGGYISPSLTLYPRLAISLRRNGISSIRVKYRRPNRLGECTLDSAIAMRFLLEEGVTKLGVVGHSFGGAVAVQSAWNVRDVKTIVLLATQSHGISPLSELGNDVSVLIVHGMQDRTLPPRTSLMAHELSKGETKLVLYDGTGHMLIKVGNKLYRQVYNWLLDKLNK